MLLSAPLITNDAVVLGMLAIILGFIFVTEKSRKPFFRKFYKYVPPLLLCYFLPSLLTTFGVVSPDESNLYFVASRYLLPASMVLLTLGIDLKGVWNLGPKALIMFFTGTLGVVIGGPIAILFVAKVAPGVIETAGPDLLWRGLSTIAGSWIGGGANMTAMKEIFGVEDQLFSAMVTIDVVVASLWMACLLFGASRSEAIDRWMRADNSAIKTLKDRATIFREKHARIPGTEDLMLLMAVGMGATALSHFGADWIAPWLQKNAPYLDRFSLTSGFFWIIMLATTIGLLLSFTRARHLDGVGASRIGSVFLYILVATIGMHMDIFAILRNPGLFLIGIVWILCHITLLLFVAWLIRAPFFFTAVGSQANIGAAASAPIVAAAFDVSLASVGVMLAVLGYALGTYAAWICAHLMRIVS